MSQVIVIPGLSTTTKRPGFFGELKAPAGSISAASIPLRLLLVGNKTSVGDMTADGAPVQILSEDEADSRAGAGSELATMAYGIGGGAGALQQQNTEVFLACVAEAASSPAFATATITISGTWTTGGTLSYRLSGWRFSVGVGGTDTVTNVAVAIVNAIMANSRVPFTATNSSGVVTVTTKNKSPRSNWHALFQDITQRPSGLTSTLAGGTAMTGGGVHFTAGAGNDSPTNLLATLASTQFDRIAIACGDSTLDATNLALWKAQVDSQAGAATGILQQIVTASNDTLTNAASITVTTLNDIRFELLHGLNEETHPMVLASTFAAARVLTEQRDPDSSYDGFVLHGCAPQTQAADIYTPAQMETALGEGVTPLFTNSSGELTVVRAITTHCRLGSNPDYRVLDTSETTVGDHILTQAELLWLTDFLPNNPRVRDNPAPEEPDPPDGVATPDLWDKATTQMLRKMERGDGYPLPIVENVDENMPASSFDPVAKRIMQALPYQTMPNQHSIGVSVRQINNV